MLGRLMLAFAIVLAACGGDGPAADGSDMSSGGSGGSGGSSGVDMTNASPDMAVRYSCGSALACSIDNPGPAGNQSCGAKATPTGYQKYKAFFDCLAAQCGNATFDAGIGPCDSADECTLCVQTGTSPTGQIIANTACTDTTTANVTVTDPKCGLCVDQLAACYNDG